MQQVQYQYGASFAHDPVQDIDDKEHEYVSKVREWENYSGTSRVLISNTKNDESFAFQVKGARTPVRSGELHKLNRGDHIGWHRWCTYWHHAIVLDIDTERRILVVIHYSKVEGVFKIVEDIIVVDEQNGEMFCFNYSADVMENNPTLTVVKRAYYLLGREHYDCFKNNCEHFATYCKTGQKESAQVKWAGVKIMTTAITSAVYIVKSALASGCNMVTKVLKTSVKSIAKDTGKAAFGEVIETLGKASNWVGTTIIVVLETGIFVHDIFRFHDNRREMTRRDFYVTFIQRVSEWVFGSAGSVVGNLFGGFIGSCIPVIGTAVGTFVGSAIGSGIGSLVGKAVGSIFGCRMGSWLGKQFSLDD